MAARPWYVSLPTSRGTAHVYPSGVTSVTADNHHTTPVIISHGKYGEAQVYLSWEEARALIGMLPMPWNCTAYINQCYRRRGTTTPNPHCLSCLLGHLCLSRRQGDFRVTLDKPVHPLKIPLVFALCSAVAVKLICVVAVDPVIERNGQLRAQVASFQRQKQTAEPRVKPLRRK